MPLRPLGRASQRCEDITTWLEERTGVMMVGLLVFCAVIIIGLVLAAIFGESDQLSCAPGTKLALVPSRETHTVMVGKTPVQQDTTVMRKVCIE